MVAKIFKKSQPTQLKCWKIWLDRVAITTDYAVKRSWFWVAKNHGRWRSNAFEDARFWFYSNLIKFATILITFSHISHKFIQILPKFRPNLPKFSQKIS